MAAPTEPALWIPICACCLLVACAARAETANGLHPEAAGGAAIVVLMGVAGAGKTVVGRLLAQDLGWRFYDGDDFHSPASVAKMRQGIALTDADRGSWLDALRGLIGELLAGGQRAVIACSALKRSYRDRLRVDPQRVRFVHLKGDYDVIRPRLRARGDHFMPADLLKSQFDALEEPSGVPAIDVRLQPREIVRRIKRELALSAEEEST
jgi:gluconokinase